MPPVGDQPRPLLVVLPEPLLDQELVSLVGLAQVVGTRRAVEIGTVKLSPNWGLFYATLIKYASKLKCFSHIFVITGS